MGLLALVPVVAILAIILIAYIIHKIRKKRKRRRRELAELAEEDLGRETGSPYPTVVLDTTKDGNGSKSTAANVIHAPSRANNTAETVPPAVPIVPTPIPAVPATGTTVQADPTVKPTTGKPKEQSSAVEKAHQVTKSERAAARTLALKDTDSILAQATIK